MPIDLGVGASVRRKMNLRLLGSKPVLQTSEFNCEKRRLLRGWRRLAIILASALPAAGLAGVGAGYLPRVGPAPLRFRPAPAPVIHHFVPPPAEPVASSAVAAPATNAPLPVPPPPAKSPAIINHVASGVPDTARPEDVVSPQMLLKDFNKGTNGASTSVIAPVDFGPTQQPVEPLKSKASYSTGP